MIKLLAGALAGLSLCGSPALSQVRIERPITIQPVLQLEPTIVARASSIRSYLQPTAQTKLELVVVLLKKQIAAQAQPDSIAAMAQAEVTRQFGRMTSEQNDILTLAALTAAAEGSQDQKDTLGELSAEVSLKLQVYQERRARYLEMLSNLMKKSSETSAAIVSNMK